LPGPLPSSHALNAATKATATASDLKWLL